MAVFERPSGPGVAERVQAEPGSPEEKELERLAADGVDGWRKVEPKVPDFVDEDEDEVREVPRPSTADTKAKWSFYVQRRYGVAPDDADEMTKAELMAYGG